MSVSVLMPMSILILPLLVVSIDLESLEILVTIAIALLGICPNSKFNEFLNKIASKIVKKLQKFGEGEVESKIIGELVMSELIKVDQVAYVRYASVYMDFKEVKDFKGLIQILDHKISDKESN